MATFGETLYSLGIELDREPPAIALRAGGFLFDHNGPYHAIKFGIGRLTRCIDHALNAIPGGAAPGSKGAFLRDHAIFRSRLRRYAALGQRAHIGNLRLGGQRQPAACESQNYMDPSGLPPAAANQHPSLPFAHSGAIPESQSIKSEVALTSSNPQSLTYRDAGVDIEAGDALVEAIKPLARATNRRGVMGGLGGFGALFDPKAAGFTDPVLVSSTDGVGTKLRVAIEAGIHDTVGIDLVAMCVNDLVVQGAEPLFFLDYFATGKLQLDQARAVISGIAEGCRQAGCALVGGETAEMPGMYAADDYDLAGFSVGAAERGQLLPAGIVAGDVLIGLRSSGVHSNGFSLVRRILAAGGLTLVDAAPFAPGQTLGAALLAPTRIYVKPLLALHRAGLLHAAAHITGGGLPGNLPRVLPAGLTAVLQAGSWPVPPVFAFLAEVGNVSADEMLRVFNCGLGMVLAVPADGAEAATRMLTEAGEAPFRIGHLEASSGPAGIRIENLPSTWPRG